MASDYDRALRQARANHEAEIETYRDAERRRLFAEQVRIRRINDASNSFLIAMTRAGTPGVELLKQRVGVSVWSGKAKTREAPGWTVASESNSSMGGTNVNYLELLVNGVFLKVSLLAISQGGEVHTIGDRSDFRYNVELENQIPVNLGKIAAENHVDWAPDQR